MNRLARLFSLIALLLVTGYAAIVLNDRLRPPPAPLLPLTGRIDHILIEKSARRLTVFRAGEALRSYDVALGFAPEGDKQHQGDGKTPEGMFTIDRRNAQSSYHLSLGIDYPLPEDRARAAARGVDAGGDIFIHGQPNGLAGLTALASDWTAGCIAVSNDQIEELWRVTPIGTAVEILP